MFNAQPTSPESWEVWDKCRQALWVRSFH